MQQFALRSEVHSDDRVIVAVRKADVGRSNALKKASGSSFSLLLVITSNRPSLARNVSRVFVDCRNSSGPLAQQVVRNSIPPWRFIDQHTGLHVAIDRPPTNLPLKNVIANVLDARIAELRIAQRDTARIVAQPFCALGGGFMCHSKNCCSRRALFRSPTASWPFRSSLDEQRPRHHSGGVHPAAINFLFPSWRCIESVPRKFIGPHLKLLACGRARMCMKFVPPEMPLNSPW